MQALHSQQASSLIETLIALVIFSLTLLGVGNLCLKSLRVTQEAFFHSMAITQIESIGNFIHFHQLSEIDFTQNEMAAWQFYLNASLPAAQIKVHSLPLQTQIDINWQTPATASSQLKLQVGEDGQQFIP